MSWIRSLGVVVAATALWGASAFASPSAKSTSHPITEQARLKDSGYSGWRLKWANINQIGNRNLCGGLDFYSLKSNAPVLQRRQSGDRVS